MTKRVWNTGGIILTGVNEVLEEKRIQAPFFTIYPLLIDLV
jgi:hypothetical protein